MNIAEQISQIYYSQFAPPLESIQLYNTALFKNLSTSVKIYYDGDKTEAELVAREREPVNIAMHKGFDINIMMDLFGWNTSAYTRLYIQNRTRLPTQIAAYCVTPVYRNKPSSDINVNVNVINSIGMAFDTKDQVDFQYFSNNNFEGAKERLEKAYSIVWKCANDNNLKTVAICLLGGGCFSSAYPGNYLEDLFYPSLESSLSKVDNLPEHIYLMGNQNKKISDSVESIVSKFGCKFKQCGYVPDILNSTDTLYQNAWDPHSMVGNGNKGDRSLDGYFGRYTGMHFLCSPITNKNIEYISI